MADQQRDPVTIASIEARNFRRLTFARVKHVPGKGLVRVHGRNGAGKSSLLSAISGAFLGARHVDERSLHEGEGSGEIRVTLTDGWSIERRFTPSQPKGYLTVRGPNDAKGRQSTLDDWMGEHSVDPQAFWSLPPDRQREILLSLSPDPELEQKLGAIRAEREDAYSERTGVISRLRSLQSVDRPDGKRPEVSDPAELIARVDRVRDREREMVREWESRMGATRELQERHRQASQRAEEEQYKRSLADRQVADLRRELAEAEERASLAAKRCAEAKRKEAAAELAMAGTDDPGPKPDLSDEIREAQAAVQDCMAANNEATKAWERWDESQKEAARLKGVKSELDQRVEGARRMERELLQGAGIPVTGLGFADEGEVLLNGQPLSVAGGAEKVAMAIEVGMARNPSIRIILLDEEANTMDDDTLSRVHELAQSEGFQIWAARVVEDPGTEIVVRDGIATDAGASG